jgi:hypothetical protein
MPHPLAAAMRRTDHEIVIRRPSDNRELWSWEGRLVVELRPASRARGAGVRASRARAWPGSITTHFARAMDFGMAISDRIEVKNDQ